MSEAIVVQVNRHDVLTGCLPDGQGEEGAWQVAHRSLQLTDQEEEQEYIMFPNLDDVLPTDYWGIFGWIFNIPKVLFS